MRNFSLAFIALFFLFSCEDEVKTKPKVQDGVPREVQILNRKISASPEDASLYYQRASVYRMLEKDSLALRDLEKTISLDTTKAFYFSAIGDLLFDKKDISGSVKWFQRAISIDPNDETAHLKIANILLYSKDYKGAFAQINAVLLQNVYNAEAYFLKGLCYKDMGKIDKAISSFQTAVQTEPKYYDAFIQLGLLHAKKKDPLALQYYDNAIRVDSMNHEAHYAKAMYHQTQNRFKEAKEVFKDALSIDRDYAEAHYNIGWMLLQQDSTEKAKREFERVIAIDPDNARAYYNRGLCNEILQDYEQSIADYEQALVFDPKFDLPTTALKRVKKKM